MRKTVAILLAVLTTVFAVVAGTLAYDAAMTCPAPAAQAGQHTGRITSGTSIQLRRRDTYTCANGAVRVH
jgi:hypothetical protein